MNYRKLFPKFNVPILVGNLTEKHQVAIYDPSKDVIILDRKLQQDIPLVSYIATIHEIMHSTLLSSRTMRGERLVSKLGRYKVDSISYRTEECIAEIGTLIACMKLNLLSPYTMNIIEDGIRQHYDSDLSIPWREVVAAVRYYAEDDTDFTKELVSVKQFLIKKYRMNIKDGYEHSNQADYRVS